jgi:hypothetical protein
MFLFLPEVSRIGREPPISATRYPPRTISVHRRVLNAQCSQATVTLQAEFTRLRKLSL